MKKIAFLTPLHPQKTGIADYAEEILPYLRASLGEEFQIDLFVDQCRPTNRELFKNHRIFQMDDFETKSAEYSLAVYQIGNNHLHMKIYELALRHPGIVVLHDFAIHHMIAAFFLEQKKDDTAYFNEVGYLHGSDARNEAYTRAANGMPGLWETNALDYPMNRRLVEHALGVVVFSQFAKERLTAYGCPTPLHRCYLHCGNEAALCTAQDRNKARKRLGIKSGADEVLIGVFGFISPAKRPYSILSAVARTIKRTGKKLRLIYIGELQPICSDLPDKVKELGLEGQVQIMGFTASEKFLDYLDASDICISLRYPTMGETSGVLNRALSRGKPSIVTNIGTFRELPDNTVAKIGYGETEVAELEEALERLVTDKRYRDMLSQNSIRYAVDHLRIADTAEDLACFLKKAVWAASLHKNEVYLNIRDKLLKTCQECCWTDDGILIPIAERLAEIFGD